MKKLAVAVAAMAAIAAQAIPNRVVGSGFGADSLYATDAYPGFDALDEVPQPEKKETSWFLWTSADTAEGQWRYVQDCLAKGSLRAARRGCDALVREWPADELAPIAQLKLAQIWSEKYENYDEAFLAVEYLLDFYSYACTPEGVGDYADIVKWAYEQVQMIEKTKKTFLGVSFFSNREVRQHYESIVRRASGAPYVPAAMMRIGALREDSNEYAEASEVYGALVQKYPESEEALKAIYRDAYSRMWLCRRLAYNIKRCKETEGFLKRTLKKYPYLPEAEEMAGWLDELEKYLEKDAYERAKFYDTRQRTRHAAIASWERFLQDHPASPHVEEVNRRLDELKGVKPLPAEAEPEAAKEDAGYGAQAEAAEADVLPGDVQVEAAQAEVAESDVQVEEAK